MAASAWASFQARGRPGEIAVDADGVRVSSDDHAWTIPARDVVAGLVLPTTTGPAVELHLGDGSVLRAGLEHERDAYAVLDRLGVGPERRRVAVTLGSVGRPLLAGCVAFPLAAILGAMMIRELAPLGPDTLKALALMLFMVASTLIARRVAEPREIVIGADGVLVRSVWGTRLVPFAEIEDALCAGNRLLLHLRDPRGGRREKLFVLRGHDAGIAAGLADRIADAIRAAGGKPSASAAAELDPAGRPLHAWRAALGKLLTGGGDYRRSALGADHLIAVLEDASAPPARRIGAAIALRDGVHPEARARVRIAADACADEDVRAALEAAAAEEIDEGPIRRVMESK